MNPENKNSEKQAIIKIHERNIAIREYLKKNDPSFNKLNLIKIRTMILKYNSNKTSAMQRDCI